LSLNFQYGHAGLVNFGQVFFFCFGAYTVAILANLKFNPAMCIVMAMFVSGVVGYLMSYTARNMGGTYWGIATLAVGEIVRLVFLNERWLAGGANGISFDMKIPFFAAVTLVLTVVSFLFTKTIMWSPFGRVLKTIREGDDLPLSLGKDVFGFKKKTMVIGGILGGLAGALFAFQKQFINPEDFFPIETFIVWAMVVVGGRGNDMGTLVGAIIIQIFYVGTRFAKDFLPFESDTLAALRMVVIGLLIMLVMMYRSKGLVQEKRRIYRVD
jgi:ABC-type branched-subunit amino acid transport system permease subunit